MWKVGWRFIYAHGTKIKKINLTQQFLLPYNLVQTVIFMDYKNVLHNLYRLGFRWGRTLVYIQKFPKTFQYGEFSSWQLSI